MEYILPSKGHQGERGDRGAAGQQVKSHRKLYFYLLYPTSNQFTHVASGRARF